MKPKFKFYFRSNYGAHLWAKMTRGTYRKPNGKVMDYTDGITVGVCVAAVEVVS